MPPPPEGTDIGLVSSGPASPDCTSPLMVIDRSKEKRRWRHARRRWKEMAAGSEYTLRVSESGSPFYRTTGREMSVDEMFREIKKLINQRTEFCDFELKYHPTRGYPKLMRWEYSGGTMMHKQMLKIKGLNMRTIVPIEPTSESTLEWVKKNRRVWQQTHAGSSGSYTFTYRLECGICPPDRQRPRHVTVLNRVVQKPVLYADTTRNEVVQEATASIDDILDEIIGGLDGGWQNYSVGKSSRENDEFVFC